MELGWETTSHIQHAGAYVPHPTSSPCNQQTQEPYMRLIMRVIPWTS